MSMIESQPNKAVADIELTVASDILPNYNIRKVEAFLMTHGVLLDNIRKLQPDDRNNYLVEKLFTPDDLTNLSTSRYDQSLNTEKYEDVGMIIIKPEMFPCLPEIKNFLEVMHFSHTSPGIIIPSKEQWLRTYGYVLKDYPNIVNVYITQRTFGIQPIIFQHLTSEEYAEIATQRDITLPSNDRDSAFDLIFCGESEIDSCKTLRGDIVLPNLSKLGFGDMSGYASSFDVCNYYKDSDPIRTVISFTGVHGPQDKLEKTKNIMTYLGDSKLTSLTDCQ